MKAYKKFLSLCFLLSLLIVVVLFEKESGYFSLLWARALYSLWDYGDTEQITDNVHERIEDKRALAYSDFLSGNAHYRSDDLTGALKHYSDSLRVFEDSDVRKNRQFVLEKLQRKKIEQQKEEQSKQNQKSGTGTEKQPKDGSWANNQPQTPGKEDIQGNTSSNTTNSGTTQWKNTQSWAVLDTKNLSKTWSTQGSGTTNPQSYSSGAVGGKYTQWKIFRQEWNLEPEDLTRALENIRKNDANKQQYLRIGNQNDSSIFDQFWSILSETDKKILGGSSSDEQPDW